MHKSSSMQFRIIVLSSQILFFPSVKSYAQKTEEGLPQYKQICNII